MKVRSGTLCCAAMHLSALGSVVPGSAAAVESLSRQAVTTCHGMVATIIGTSRPDVLTGTSRNDVIVARGGADRVVGRAGDDVICAGPGSDVVRAGTGLNMVYGQGGQDVISDEGNDRSVLDGGAGDDSVNVDSGSYTRVFGGPGDDTLRSGPSGNRLYGESGNDKLVSRSVRGRDVFRGGPGQDDLLTTRRHLAEGDFSGVVARLLGDGDRVHVRAPGDFVSVSLDYRIATGAVTFDLETGEGSVEGLIGPDMLMRASSSHAPISLVGGRHADHLFGDDQPNWISGGIGSGADVIEGRGGPDTIFGLRGDDQIDGGDGEDEANGGPGTDVCVNVESATDCE